MKRLSFISILMVIVLLTQSFAVCVSAEDSIDVIEPDNGVSDSEIENVKTEPYREGLMYSDDLLASYEAYVSALEERNLPLELCVEDFAEIYNAGGTVEIPEQSTILDIQIEEIQSPEPDAEVASSSIITGGSATAARAMEISCL